MRAKRLLLTIAGASAAAALTLWDAGMAANASGRYNSPEETESAEVIALSGEIGGMYGICPELLQAIAFHESDNRPWLVSAGGDVGLMQVSPRWHGERMERLWVDDLTDARGCMLVAADYLHELFVEHEDPALVLMCYNMGPSKAVRAYEGGMVSGYARDVLKLSEGLERLHESREAERKWRLREAVGSRAPGRWILQER